MIPARNVIQGTAGGLVGGSVLGLAEALYLLATQGAPDLLSPFYAVVLYGLVGLPLGFGGGVAFSLVERFKRFGTRGEAIAFAAGSVAAVGPVLLFVLFYLVNKVVYAEQGIPTLGKLVILGVVGGGAALVLTVGVSLLQGPLRFLLRGPGALGAFGGLAVVTGVVAALPYGDDPRAGFAHGKPVPHGLADAPNVLMITIDTLRADYLGTYGKEGNPTPVLDAIAADGVVFEKAFAHASWTRSSFASLFSSRIPSSHNAGLKASRLPDDVDLISEVLQQAGFTTGNLANNINVTRTFNFDQGYDSFVYEAPSYSFGATESVFSLTLYKVIHKLNERLGGSKEVERFYQPAEVVLADAKAFIEANRDSRWYLGVHLMEPHDPYFEHPYLRGEGTAEFNGVGFARAEVENPSLDQAEYLKQVYLDEIRHMDRKLAPFVAWLKETGLYDRTVIVVTSDHGEEFGEHGGFWHGTTLYEEQIHVPLIVKLPGQEFAGTRIPWQARHIDVAPTLAQLVGVAPSPQWEGRDLLGDVRRAVAAEQERRAKLEALEAQVAGYLAQAGDDPDLAVAASEKQAELEALTAPADPCAAYVHELDRPVVAEQDFEGNVLSALRRDGFKYVRANAGNPRGLPEHALFDVVSDPGETKNLYGQDDERCGKRMSELPVAFGSELDVVIAAGRARAKDGGTVETSEAETCNLCALGYKSGPECARCN